MIFCYVILHYRTDTDTVDCVESIIKLDSSSEIVIVDNASNNGSIERVENRYANEKRVHILKNKNNLGFASGNNVGYKYAKTVLKADYIAISNNDIVIKTNKFSTLIDEFYKKNQFEILGPDIVSVVDGGHQNPMEETLVSKGKVQKEIWRYRFLLFLSKCGIYDILKPNRVSKTGSSRKKCVENIQMDVMLHGSFVVFSPLFVRNEDISFREGTFLYTEEAILRKYCRIKGYRMAYNPFLIVEHKEDSSTNSLGYTSKRKREFIFRNMIKSLSVYKSYF